MNIFNKIYCRTFQKIMRWAIPLLPYREPILLDGIMDVTAVLKGEKKNKVILITDKNLQNLGLIAPLENSLKENKITCIVFNETNTNPTISNVEMARTAYLTNACQAIIAFGGGSPMDCAKALGARIARPGKSLHQMKGLLKVRKRIPLLIAIPTTAGTGSETTLAAVITDDKTHHKYPINDFNLIPRYAVMAPEVTVELPPQLTATTGMDALTHAVEVYIGRSMTKDSKKNSLEAIQLILANLEHVYADGKNSEARKNMLRASYLAGTAFTKSYVGYVHAVAHSLGGKYGVPHGLANAVLLPHVLRAYDDSVTNRLAELAYLTCLADKNISMKDAAEIFLCKIEEMNRNMQIPTTIKELKKDDIPDLANLADKEANPLYPVPLLWDAKELEGIYEAILVSE